MIVFDGWAVLWNLLAALGAMLVVFIAVMVVIATGRARWFFIIPGAVLTVLLVAVLVLL